MANQKPYFSPVWPDKMTSKKLKSGSVRFTAIGREMKCCRCKEFWPADSEFYSSFSSITLGINRYCKSCMAEKKEEYKINKVHKVNSLANPVNSSAQLSIM